MSKKVNKSIQKKDTKQVVLLPFSQQYNSQDSLFNEENEGLNSQYLNNIFSKPLSKDNIQFTTGSNTTGKQLGVPNRMFENEWENNLNDVPIQKFKANEFNNKKNEEGKRQNQNEQINFNLRQDEMEQESKNQDEEGDDEDMFEPEYLVDKRIVNGQIEYLVKWVEFSVEESTWEPAENIQVCAYDLIQIFEESKKQSGNKSNLISNNRSPITTPLQRKQMHSPNLQKNSNLSQLRGRSPLRKSQQVTPQIKSGIDRSEQSISSFINQKNVEVPPLINQNQRNLHQNFNQNQIAEEKIQLLKSISSNQNSRVFDNKFQNENRQQDNYSKSLTPKNYKKQMDDENIIKQVYNSQGEIIFEQKKMTKDTNEKYDKSKSPLLKLVQDSTFYQKITQNTTNSKTPQTTPIKQQDSSPFHTPVGKSQNQIWQKSKSPMNAPAQKDNQQQKNTPIQNRKLENQYANQADMDIEDSLEGKFALANAKRGRPAQNKRVEIPPSPIMTPTPNVNDKSPISKINRKKIYQDIQMSDDLLKSPIQTIQKSTPINKKNQQRESFIPQSPPMIIDQLQQKQQSGKKKRLYKRIEISDHESSDIENIEFLENKNYKYDDNILPAFQEYQKNTRGKRQINNYRSQTASTSITPTKSKGDITPNNQKAKTPIQNQNQQNSTPLNKQQYKENDQILLDIQQRVATQQITPNKRVTSIWQCNKNSTLKDSATPSKYQQAVNKTPIKNQQDLQKTPQKVNQVKTPNKETKSPISKKDPKSPINKQNKKSPISKENPKSPISKQNQKSPISKTMEIEENSKRKRRRQPSSISDEELTAFKQNEEFESTIEQVQKSDLTPAKNFNQTPIKKSDQTPLKKGSHTPIKRGDQTPIKKGDQTPIKKFDQTPIQRGDQTPKRRSTRNRDEKDEQQDDYQSTRDFNQVHQKLHENRVQLQTQSERINQVLNSSKENLRALNQVTFKVQKEEKEDLYSRVKKRVENIINQQQNPEPNITTNKKSNFETPVKEKASTQEKTTPESKSKNSRQSSAKKSKKIDPKTNIKKNGLRSATKDKVEIATNQSANDESLNQNNYSSRISNEQFLNGIEQQSRVNENHSKNQKSKSAAKNKKEDKNILKDKEKQEKQNILIEQQVEQNNNNLNNHLEVTPQTHNSKTRRVSQRLSNLKPDNLKEDKVQASQTNLVEQQHHITTRRSQNNLKEIEQNQLQDQFRTPVKQNNRNNQKVDPKGRLTRNSMKKNENCAENIQNENDNQGMELEEQKQDSEVSNKMKDKNEVDQKLNTVETLNISKILTLIPLKKQRRGSKIPQNNSKDYPQFEVEMSDGSQKILSYNQIVDQNPKMVADFLIKDYM